MEDSRNSKVSSVPLGADARTAKAANETTEVTVPEEGEEETGENEDFLFFKLITAKIRFGTLLKSAL